MTDPTPCLNCGCLIWPNGLHRNGSEDCHAWEVEH